ncbi:LacI family DNA-binding transcriptional regulator [Bifidobacterium aquikefiri]|uniref:LacI family DNA-binding transcriptional regulator n=1 Tax=Bifidobacterium aquikefiri TaxID=1653207 RepID=UPI0023F310F0|nr:LacI family DNA-binding transcriptional regulator [Bifidobacterium aquikefiri]
MSSKKPTVYDVAKEAGVSIASVSRALRKPESVRPATRELIDRAIERLGYVPSGSAQSLAARRTGVIGLFMSNLDELDDLQDFTLSSVDDARVKIDPTHHTDYHRNDSLYYDQVLRGCELETWRRGLSLMVNLGLDRNEKGLTQLAGEMAGKVDGLIVMARSVPDSTLEFLKRRVPVVMVADAPSDNEAGYDLVRVSNRKGMRKLVQHLIDTHHVDDFAYIAGPDDSPDNHKRYVGFCEGLRSRDINPETVPIYRAGFSFAVARTITLDMVTRHKIPRALVCANDQMALGVCKALTDSNIRIPQDVIVTGFDGIKESETNAPRITTVSQPMRNLGRAAVSTMVQRLENPDAEPYAIELPVTLLLRESSEGEISKKRPATNI